MSVWTFPAASHAVPPRRSARDIASLPASAVKKAMRSSSSQAAAITRSRPASAIAELAPQLGRRLVVAEVGELRLDPGADRHHARAAVRRVLGERGRRLVLALGDVRDVEDGLRRQRRELARRVGRGLRHRHVAHRASAGQRLHDRLQPVALGDRLGVARSGALGHPGEPPLRLLEVGGKSSVSTSSASATGSIRPSGCGTPPASCARTTWQIASVSRIAPRKRFPKTLAGGRPAHEPRDVPELHRLRHDLRRAERLGDRLEPLVGHRDDGDVRVDRGERVVASLGAGLGEGVEQGRLARVRQADDADPHAGSPLAATRSISRSSSERSPTLGTSPPMASPRAAPARTSLG